MFSKFLEYSFCSNYKWFGFSLILIPKSTTGHSHDYGDDLDYSGMETIELCDNMELEDSCILVDNNALYAVSYRTRKLMSFKVASLSLSVTQAPVTVVSLCSQERIFSFYLFKFWMAWLKKKSTGTSFLPFVINFLPTTGKNLRKMEKEKKKSYVYQNENVTIIGRCQLYFSISWSTFSWKPRIFVWNPSKSWLYQNPEKFHWKHASFKWNYKKTFLFFVFKYLFIIKIVKPRWICCCPNLFSFHQKRIQEAFVPKKRLAKEYEQLAIWFGDAYMGPEQNTLQNLLPATSSATLESENSRTRHICDSEWELL